MKKSKGLKILVRVARQYGVSVDEVRQEIQTAIDIGMQSTDPVVREKWRSLCKDGKAPTPEAAVILLAKEINCKSDN